ncbi:hypothetical protein [Blastomonas sp.]|uniref:hypothetical protein n=1 Tax=Blastomonas sp. TaxID=1909299 RepID=UPI00263363CA|nr:hypothetical protein [Blastomonas sp.]MDM7957168.1 hypothetical protein [Blastomonas sp.]
MKNAFFGTLIAAGALAATPALAQDMVPGTPEAPTTETPAAPMNDPAMDAPATAEQAPPATLDTNGDGVADAWDRNGDGQPDAWDTNGDGQPDKADPMEAAE